MSWDPDLYNKFQSERSAPFEDLRKLLRVREGLRVVDLGCGTGELTRRLADMLPGSEVVGMDTSSKMLEVAAQHSRPGLSLELGSIEEVDGEWDVVFSNAALHWVDDHAVVVPRLFSLLRPGGQIVVQVPSNHSHPTQTLLSNLAGELPFVEVLGGWSRMSPVLSIGAYAELLYAHGGTEITAFEKVYPHVLESPDALADWMCGTTMVPYLERLPDGVRESFVDAYRERIRGAWPLGPVFFPFRRTLFAATCPDRPRTDELIFGKGS